MPQPNPVPWTERVELRLAEIAGRLARLEAMVGVEHMDAAQEQVRQAMQLLATNDDTAA